MSALNFTVFTDRVLREWPRIEMYQNSTLRYTPPKDFPAYWVKQNGRPKVIRTWVTLDEIWDQETDTYDWNYQIGVDKLGDKRYYAYDWPITRPSETHFEDYLTCFCAMAEEAMLNVRRFERETADGLMSYEKYEEVCEKVIEHCVQLCPNIVYIEASNESEIPYFGSLTVKEYMPLYNAICRVVTRLNRKHGWDLKVGGTAMTGTYTVKGMWHEFMQALAEDDCPDKKIDFYSMHTYTTDSNRLQQIYNIHRADIAKYGLPDVVVFFDEYGAMPCSAEPLDGLHNAAGTMAGMLRSADLENFHVFPWCTFHNPVLQMSYTQYIRLPEGGYAPTPNGLAAHMLWGMLRNELHVQGDTQFRVRATGEDGKFYLILTNPDEEALTVSCTLENLVGTRAKVSICQVDEKRNNAVMNPPCMELGVTETREIEIVEGKAAISCELPRYGFASWLIEIE